MIYGLRELQKDERDLSVGALFSLPKLEELPDSFDIPTLEIKDQGESDFCAAYASCSASEIQEAKKLEPAWTFAISKTLSGDVDEYGQDLRTIMKTHVKFGAIEKSDVDQSIKNRSADHLRRIENWNDKLRRIAIYHKKASFMDCKGPYDAFDNIRACMWKFKNEKRAVVSGVKWGWDSDIEKIDDMGTPKGGHAILYRGWKGEYLLMQNSYGKDAGRNGVHLIHRSVVNDYVGRYGAFMFQDISPEEARWYLNNGKKADRSWLLNLISTFFKL